MKLQPWQVKPLDEWSIVGMNHYHVDGTKRLFVAMTKDGLSIQAEGPDTALLWKELKQKAHKAMIGRDKALRSTRATKDSKATFDGYRCITFFGYTFRWERER